MSLCRQPHQGEPLNCRQDWPSGAPGPWAQVGVGETIFLKTRQDKKRTGKLEARKIFEKRNMREIRNKTDLETRNGQTWERRKKP